MPAERLEIMTWGQVRLRLLGYEPRNATDVGVLDDHLRAGGRDRGRAEYGLGVTEIPTAVAAELARLRAENARLLKMLELSPRQAAPPGPA